VIKAPILKPAWNAIYNSWGFELMEDYAFSIVGGGVLTVPAGFWYNSANIPKPFWQITYSPFDPIILTGALAHDWLYTSKQVSREVADKTLEEYLVEFGGNKIKADAILLAVRVFGSSSWDDSYKDIRYLNSLRAKIKSSGRSLMKYGL